MARPKRPAAHLPEGLNRSQYAFCLAYLGNGYNGAQAYHTAYPAAQPDTCRSAAAELIAKPSVKAFLDSKLAPIWKAQQMDGEEAAARIALIASADVSLCFAGNTLRPVQDWPWEVRMAVESYDIAGKVKLASRLQALRTILELTGKVRSTADSIDDLAAAMKADREKHTK